MTDIQTIPDEDRVASVPLPDEAATRALGARLAPVLRPGDILALWGDLGAGKSTLARGLIQAAMGEAIEVPSPTFTLVQIYELPDYDLWHMDLYRLDDPEDVFELGVEDAFAEAVSLIEWPARMGGYLPLHRLDIRIEQTGNGQAGGDGRQATLSAPPGEWHNRLAGIL
ncbi:tRNA (adenosine(37)-N6)-threonylcarbamoyltransferase complex ATPase subunit type 1 TsaE [Hwanghaeella sp.]|uniref:tRNA (adenosine(37)-N6)-threonylcarbamoyltransferase complex ATPase subunit type 1 TsaE n=1 Tax=Hwanghaeella sp. TaxID=2605943 RepID=UPI003CCBBF7F